MFMRMCSRRQMRRMRRYWRVYSRFLLNWKSRFWYHHDCTSPAPCFCNILFSSPSCEVCPSRSCDALFWTLEQCAPFSDWWHSCLWPFSFPAWVELQGRSVSSFCSLFTLSSHIVSPRWSQLPRLLKSIVTYRNVMKSPCSTMNQQVTKGLTSGC